MKIEISVKAGVQSHDWQRVAYKRARAAAADAGIPWQDADVFVLLAEAGRCLTKAPGDISLIAHG